MSSAEVPRVLTSEPQPQPLTRNPSSGKNPTRVTHSVCVCSLGPGLCIKRLGTAGCKQDTVFVSSSLGLQPWKCAPDCSPRLFRLVFHVCELLLSAARLTGCFSEGPAPSPCLLTWTTYLFNKAQGAGMKCHQLDTQGPEWGGSATPTPRSRGGGRLALDPSPASAQWKLSPDFTSRGFAQVPGGL